MFPIGDDRVEGGPAPLITIGLVVLNVLAFLFELSRPTEGALQSFIQAWGVVPREYRMAQDIAPIIPLPYWTTLLTSMFLHGGWLHLLGNCLFFWVFGNNVEDSMGRIRFLVFYLVCGLAAAATHILVQRGSPVPTVGASGAISGVLGAYLMLYPKVRVRMLFFFIVFFKVIPIPAWAVLLWWFALQLIGGLPELTSMRPEVSSGVAVWAHIGGFLTGLILVKLFENPSLVARRAVPANTFRLT